MTELSHYGVKGMHWGVRKNIPTNPDYNKSQQRYDRQQYGQGAVKRINRRMNAGQDIATARKNERKFRTKAGLAIGVGLNVAPFAPELARAAGLIVKELGYVAAQNVAQRAETKRGEAYLADTMGLPRRATNGPSYSKQNRKGVYNISSM